MKLLGKILKISLFIFLFLVFLKPVIDPDFGWHLRQGLWMVENKQIIREDVLSWSFQGYKWEDFYWLTEVFFALVDKFLSLNFLSFFFSLYLVFFFWLVLRKKKLGILGYLAILLAVYLLSGFVGVRPQVLSYGYFALLFYWFRRVSQRAIPAAGGAKFLLRGGVAPAAHLGRWDRAYFLPLLFLLWANTHGSFLAGLAFLGIFVLLLSLRGVLIRRLAEKNDEAISISGFFQRLLLPHSLRNRNGRELKRLLSIAAFSFLATLLNPYGADWSSLFGYLGNEVNRNNILEFQPINFHYLYAWVFLLWVGVYYKLTALKDSPCREQGLSLSKNLRFFLTIPLVCMSFYAVRFIPIFVLVTLPEMVEGLGRLEKKLPVILKNLTFLLKLYILLIFLVLSLKFVLDSLWQLNSSDQLQKAGKYPLKAASFLKKEEIKGRLFNQYEWGGFLAWQVPEIRTFIDGRMPSWKKNNREIFADYLELINLKPGWQEILDYYQINLVLIKSDSPLTQVFNTSQEWRLIYKDKTAAVFQKS